MDFKSIENLSEELLDKIYDEELIANMKYQPCNCVIEEGLIDYNCYVYVDYSNGCYNYTFCPLTQQAGEAPCTQHCDGACQAAGGLYGQFK